MRFTNIEIKDHPYMESVKLLALQRIIVVCGKNNSGKTTFLKEVSTKENVIWGKAITDEIFEKLVKTVMAWQGWNIQGNALNITCRTALGVFRRQFEEGVWHNERVIFHERLFKCLRVTGHFNTDIQGVSNNFFEQNFSPKWKSIYIPSDRSLEASSGNNPHDDVNQVTSDSDGRGLLAALFVMQNQTIDHEKRVIFEKIRQAFKWVTEGSDFSLSIASRGMIELKISNDGSKFHLASQCGLGLRQILLFLYFIYEKDRNLIAIEELESNLHPEMVRRLMATVMDDYRGLLIVSTHSNVVIGCQQESTLLHCLNSAGKISIKNSTEKAALLSSIGYSVSENLGPDLVVLVEGPGDVEGYGTLISKFKDLSSLNIKFWPMGGDIMGSLDLSVFKGSWNICAVIDKDPKSKSARDQIKKNCRSLGVEFHQLSCYAIENCFTRRAISQVFPFEMKEKSGDGFFDFGLKLHDEKHPEKSQIEFSIKKRIKKIMLAMTVDEIEISPLKDVLGFLRERINSFKSESIKKSTRPIA